jgi:GNAT superfamily N-acetyltransferase
MEQPHQQPDMGARVGIAARDGRVLGVRHMRVSDAALLERLFYRLSPQTRYRRFFVPLDSIDEARVRHEAARLATIDPAVETALIAVCEEADGEEAVAVARYILLRERPDSCEGSIVVRDDFQGSGVGRQLFDLLVQSAIAAGLRHMVLLTHADNLGMIKLAQGVGMPYKSRLSAGLYEIDLQLTTGAQAFFPFTAPS